jgi:hypothetical protein
MRETVSTGIDKSTPSADIDKSTSAENIDKSTFDFSAQIAGVIAAARENMSGVAITLALSELVARLRFDTWQQVYEQQIAEK